MKWLHNNTFNYKNNIKLVSFKAIVQMEDLY